MAFYDAFEYLCNQKGVTPTQVARDNNITQQMVSLWKRRGSIPSGENLKKLAIYFGVSTDFLLEIQPLKPIEEEFLPGEILKYDSADQEFLAMEEFISKMGYHIALAPLKHRESEFILADNRSGRIYIIPGGKISELLESIRLYTLREIETMILNLEEISDAEIGKPECDNNQYICDSDDFQVQDDLPLTDGFHNNK